MNHPPMTEAPGQFLAAFRAALAEGAFSKLILGSYRGAEPGLLKLIVRPVVIKQQPRLSWLYHYATRDITKNRPVPEGVSTLEALLGKDFHAAHLFSTTEELHLKFDRRGAARLTRAKPCHREAGSVAHDRPKQRRLDPGRPFLEALGLTDTRQAVLPSMSHKWKQINRFLEVFDHAFAASALAGRSSLTVLDFGCGKGYLTFALHDYLRHACHIDARVTGVELRPDLVAFCSGVAKRLNCEGLTFCQGSIASQADPAMDVMVALHACDTATDLALFKGITAGAGLLLCAPCCHKQLRPQMTPPAVLQPVLRFGVQLGQEAEMVTDSLRALLLEANGYQVNLFEFVSLEHTDKNKMISAVKRPAAGQRDQALARIHALKEFYGIREQELERLLQSGAGP